jgi:predicted HD superfamily hydrolase involved in NAD metabolism
MKSPNNAVNKEQPKQGIPGDLTLDVARSFTEKRISKKRFEHVCGVAEVGELLAKRANVDSYLVALACWLHDCCKEIKDKELVNLAREGGLKPTAIEEENGHLLHGPVAALTIERELGITNKEVLQSVSEHTLGNVPMSDISKVVFLADCLEKSRPTAFTAPIWEALGSPMADKKKAVVNLNKAMLKASDLSLAHLLESGRVIHPKTVDVRNYFLGIVRAVEKAKV